MTTIYNVVCQSQIVNPEEKATFKKVGYLKVTEAGGHYLHLYHDRTITPGIQSLIEKRMIEVTDSRGFSLADPKKRKFTQRIFYALKVDSLAQVADNQSKKYAQATQDLHRTPQELRTTQNNPTQKQFSKPHNRKLTDAERIQEIKWKQDQKKC